MDAKKLAGALQDAEIVVLKSLKRGSALSVEELSKKSHLKPEAINRAALWLGNKGLVSVKEHSHFAAQLEKLGEKYAARELPEKKFLHVVASDVNLIDEIAAQAGLDKQETLFSLGYWKRKGAIKVEQGKVSITELGREYVTKQTAEEEFLKKLAERGSVDLSELSGEERFAFEQLSKRGLVKKVERKVREFSATELGLKVADSIRAGARIGQLSPETIKSKAWKSASFRRYDIIAPVPKIWPGKKQAYLHYLDEVREEMVAFGFEEMSGPLVELSLWNADALYMPQDHPARGIHDVYFIKEPKYGRLTNRDLVRAVRSVHENGGKSGSKGWQYEFSEKEAGRLLLRSHGTALSARMLSSPDLKIPGGYFAIARAYRPDKIDATHLTEFNQMEGIVLKEKTSFRNLLGLLAEFARKLAGTEKVRFMPSYFPFTEPSVQGMVFHPELKAWIEILPAGLFRPEVTAPFNIKVPVLAWGIGIDRLFMIREGLTDIRQLFSQDLQWLREAKL